MEVSDARRLRQFEDENRLLKYMVADQAHDIQALKAVARRGTVTPSPFESF
jgi:putative transposase